MAPTPHEQLDPPEADGVLNPHLWRRLSELELSERTASCLAAADIVFVGELCGKTRAELLAIDGFGKQALFEIRNLLVGWYLDVEMDVSAWKPPADRGSSSPARVLPALATVYEWDETPAGIAVFVPSALAPSLAELIERACARGHACEVPDHTGRAIVFTGDGGDGGHACFHFDDDDCLVISFTEDDAARLASSLAAGTRTFPLGDEIRIHLR